MQQFPGPGQFLQPPSPAIAAICGGPTNTTHCSASSRGSRMFLLSNLRVMPSPRRGSPTFLPSRTLPIHRRRRGSCMFLLSNLRVMPSSRRGGPTFLPSRTRPIHRRSTGSRMFLLSGLCTNPPSRYATPQSLTRCKQPHQVGLYKSDHGPPCLASRQITHFSSAGRPPWTAGFSMLAAVVASITTAFWKPARLNDRAADRCSAPSVWPRKA